VFPAALTVATYCVVLVTGEMEYITARTTNVQDSSFLLNSTKPTATTENLTTTSPTSKPEEESTELISEHTTTIWPKTQHTSAESLNGLEFTQQETISEQTSLFTTNNTSETTIRLSEYITGSNVVLETSTETAVETLSATNIVSVSETVTSLPSSVAQSLTVPIFSVVSEATEPSNKLLEADTIVTSESETLPTEQFAITDEASLTDSETTVQNSAEITPDIPDLNGVSSSTTECPSFPSTTLSTSFKPNIPYYHCTETGHFPARPSCIEYHVCRRVGFWLIHFKATCHFGHQFSLQFRFCVPSYLSDCNRDPYLVNASMKDDEHNAQNDNSSSEFDDDNGECENEEEFRRTLLTSILKTRITL
jgi:hypothetical protein